MLSYSCMCLCVYIYRKRIQSLSPLKAYTHLAAWILVELGPAVGQHERDQITKFAPIAKSFSAKLFSPFNITSITYSRM